MVRCLTIRCSGLGLRCCTRRIAWYFALQFAAVGWVCAAALDENAWYVALLHSAGSWACATAPDESARYVTLLHAAVG